MKIEVKGLRDMYIHVNFDFGIKIKIIQLTKARAINRYNFYVNGIFKFVKGKARAWRELSKDDPPVLSERAL